MQRSEMMFEKGTILRKEMLEDLYAYPRAAVEAYYHRYSDGILYGLGWCGHKDKNGNHLIMPGALKLHGEIYFLAECIDVEEVLKEEIEIDNRYRLYFIKGNAVEESAGRTVYPLELKAVQLAEKEGARENGFYYARVECGSGKKLRLIEDKDEMYGLAAAKDGYHFQIPYYAANGKLRGIIEGKKDKHPLDFMLLKEIYVGNGIDLSFARMYLNEAGVSCEDEDFGNPLKVMEKLTEACSGLTFERGYTAGKDDNEDDGAMLHITKIQDGLLL